MSRWSKMIDLNLVDTTTVKRDVKILRVEEEDNEEVDNEVELYENIQRAIEDTHCSLMEYVDDKKINLLTVLRSTDLIDFFYYPYKPYL